jgi:hypothetical protein
MVQCKTDNSLLTKHDKNGKLILWAVTYIDEVVYGGSKSETNDLKNQAVGHVDIVEIGRLDMHLGVHNSLEAGEYESHFGYSIAQYMAKMYSTEAIHVKHAANINNETFHPSIGEGVESTKYVRPIGRKRDSGRATESSEIEDSGTETNDSFRSDSDELETD